MTNSMTYKDYVAKIEYDPRDDIVVGRVLGLEESITFHPIDFHRQGTKDKGVPAYPARDGQAPRRHRSDCFPTVDQSKFRVQGVGEGRQDA